MRIYLWFEHDDDVKWMNEIKEELLRNCCKLMWELELWFEQLLEVFFLGSEELFSPFLASTLPDFL